MLMRKIDRATGLFIEDVALDVRPLPEEADPDTLLIATPCPDGFYRPRWDAEQELWEEGATPEEITILSAPPKPAPTQEQINAANIEYLAMMTGVEL